jgi:hypothetical protein
VSRRRAHGSAKRHGAVIVYETRPTDEQQRRSQAAEADPLVTDRAADGTVRSTAAARALAKLPRAKRMVPRAVASHPQFKRHEDRRREWLSKRRSEIHAAHGGVSYGVGARLNAAAWSYAAADFCDEQAALTLDVDLFKSAATLKANAKTLDDAAWELARLEADGRPRGVDPITALQNEIAGARLLK